VDQVVRVLDPVLTPLGFESGQAGVAERSAQVIFCRGQAGSTDGDCVDLIIDLELAAVWRIRDVRYWGFPADRWHLPFDDGADLPDQLDQLAQSLPVELA